MIKVELPYFLQLLGYHSILNKLSTLFSADEAVVFHWTFHHPEDVFVNIKNINVVAIYSPARPLYEGPFKVQRLYFELGDALAKKFVQVGLIWSFNNLILNFSLVKILNGKSRDQNQWAFFSLSLIVVELDAYIIVFETLLKEVVSDGDFTQRRNNSVMILPTLLL